MQDIAKSSFWKRVLYSDYLKLILFTKLTGNNEYAVYARIADVIQANMGQKISNNSGFVMKKRMSIIQQKQI